MKGCKAVFYLFFVISVFASCSAGKHASGSSSDRGTKIVSGDINLYQYMGVGTTMDGNRVRTYTYWYYKAQKGEGGPKVALNSKNLKPMLDGYQPALDWVSKYNRVNRVHTVWRTVNLVGIIGGLALVGIGTNNAVKGYNKGGGQILEGFGVVLVAGGSYWILNKAADRNLRKLDSAIVIYNNRVK